MLLIKINILNNDHLKLFLLSHSKLDIEYFFFDKKYDACNIHIFTVSTVIIETLQARL